ncbi:dihydrofolate reductase [Erythrobacteraceae bacterium E2-1 Yellow Sea]|nr:dihydrofolate reductase [Erythrobacteraceae bacterium E2-1 Yellow Sea]
MQGQRSLESLTSIVAIDLRGAIGCDNSLPWRLRSDMAFFKEHTISNTVIMGRKTYDSLGQKPLPKRNNIVLSHNNVLFDSSPICQLALSVDEALVIAGQYNDEEAFVIGGAQTYHQFDSIVDRYLVTVVDHEVPNADAFLSSSVLDSMRDWKRREIASHQAVEGKDEFPFSIFELVAPDSEARRARRDARLQKYLSMSGRPKPSVRRRSSTSIIQDAFAF